MSDKLGAQPLVAPVQGCLIGEIKALRGLRVGSWQSTSKIVATSVLAGLPNENRVQLQKITITMILEPH